MAGSRLPAVFGAAAWAALAGVLTVWGGVPATEAVWSSVAVAAALVPSGWLAPGGWRRRLAEAAILPTALSFTLLADPVMRRMVFPVLLLGVAGLAAKAAFHRTPPHRQPILMAALAVALRAATGLALAGHPWPVLIIALVAPPLIAWAATRALGAAGGGAVALIAGALPLQQSPRLGTALILGGIVLLLRRRPLFDATRLGRGLLPAAGVFAAAALALGPWGGLGPQQLFPRPAAAFLGLAVVLLAGSVRVPPALTGALVFLLTVTLAPLQPSPPDRAAITLSADSPTAVLPVADRSDYVMDLALAHGSTLPQGAAVATLSWDSRTHVLGAGVHAVEWAARRPDVAARLQHHLPVWTVWRPTGAGRQAVFGAAGRHTPPIPADAAPILHRHEGLPDGVTLTVTAGPSRPTPPRRWTLSAWLTAGAAVVAVLQVVARTWALPTSWVPWALLALGSVAARTPVEPLRLLAERHAVDLALAGLLAAWLPAAWRWLQQRRTWRAAASLLVPLALATPFLTPPLHGDEPFHLALMDTMLRHRSLDLAAHAGYPADLARLHAPTLALVLLPAYTVAGRAGALVLMALAGSLVVVVVIRRAEQLGLRRTNRVLLALGLLLSLPLAVFSTQLWVEVPGALLASLLLVGVGARRTGVAAAAGLVAAATALKTRLLLATLPVSLGAFWRLSPGRRRTLAAGLALAAGTGMALAWITQGHPFGPFRRLVHIFPGDPLQIAAVLAGLLFDASAGMLGMVPLGLIALAGVVGLWRHGEAGERGLLLGMGMTVLLLLHSHEWYGGGSPPVRYLTPFLPVLALSAVFLVQRRPPTRHLAVLLAPLAFLAWWSLVSRPHLSINPGDGSFWLTDALARRLGAEVSPWVPSFLRPESASWSAAALVSLLILAAAASVRWRPDWLRHLGRWAPVLWLAAAALLLTAVWLRPDVVVQVEAAQVARHGGDPHPEPGTFSRFLQPNGWRLRDGHGLEVPLHLRGEAEVLLFGWLLEGHGAPSSFRGRWEGGEEWRTPAPAVLDVPVRLPTPPAAGRRRLFLWLEAEEGAVTVLDRIEVLR